MPTGVHATGFAEMRQILANEIRELPPGAFAIVMATGIVSVAAHLLELPAIAAPLLPINIALYSILAALLITRLVRYFPYFSRDVADHARGPGLFTVVAATCVLGKQVVLLSGGLAAASMLWILAIATWSLLFYTFLTIVTIGARKPALVAGLNGSWLLVVVATQAISILASLVAGIMRPWQASMLFLALGFYLAACLLYVVIITLVFYRLVFFDVDAAALTATYWISMGGAAITVAAGATLLLQGSEWELLRDLSGFVKGVACLFWAVATGWIPFLLLLGLWRHLYRGVALHYDTQYWGIVFPLGMYSAATHRLASVLELPTLIPIARLFLYAAALAWLVTMLGLVHWLYRLLRPGRTLSVWGVGIALLRQSGRGARSRGRQSAFSPRAAGGGPRNSPEAGALPVLNDPAVLRLLCPLHGVAADVTLVMSQPAGGCELLTCSLVPSNGAHALERLPCGGRCVHSRSSGVPGVAPRSERR